jgi:hypothetical protein
VPPFTTKDSARVAELPNAPEAPWTMFLSFFSL